MRKYFILIKENNINGRDYDLQLKAVTQLSLIGTKTPIVKGFKVLKECESWDKAKEEIRRIKQEIKELIN